MLPLQGYKRRILLIPMMLLACTLRVMEATEYKIQGIRGQSSTLIKMSYRIGRGGAYHASLLLSPTPFASLERLAIFHLHYPRNVYTDAPQHSSYAAKTGSSTCGLVINDSWSNDISNLREQCLQVQLCHRLRQATNI